MLSTLNGPSQDAVSHLKLDGYKRPKRNYKLVLIQVQL